MQFHVQAQKSARARSFAYILITPIDLMIWLVDLWLSLCSHNPQLRANDLQYRT